MHNIEKWKPEIGVETIIGDYSDEYFNRTRQILKDNGMDTRVRMQVFQKKDAVLCGMDEALGLISRCAENAEDLTVKTLCDGDKIAPYETVMTIEGDFSAFAHLETVYLGILARATRVCTNASRVVGAANGKPVYFFPARFDHHLMQRTDGFAAYIAGCDAVSTAEQAWGFDGEAKGTIPHALIAAFGGDTVKATLAFSEAYPDVPTISLVDYDNDCVNTAGLVADAMKMEGRKLYGVRLDTSGTMVDKSIVDDMGQFKPTGVCAELVHKVRTRLDLTGHSHVRIFVSGGFNPEKIAAFEAARVPVDGYGVGSSMFAGNYDFTADIVKVEGETQSKVGRADCPNNRLMGVKL